MKRAILSDLAQTSAVFLSLPPVHKPGVDISKAIARIEKRFAGRRSWSPGFVGTAQVLPKYAEAGGRLCLLALPAGEDGKP